MSIARAAAVGALVVAIIAVGVLMFGGGGGTEYTVRMQTANQLVKGNQVRVGGLAVGEITDIKLSEDNQADIKVTINDDFAPLRRGSSITVRQESLPSVANRYLSLHPGPNNGEEIPDGGTLDADETTNVVDLDQLFNTLDPKARKGLQGVLRGFGTWYVGQSDNLQDTFKYLAPSLGNLSRGDGGAGARPEDVREPDRERRQGDRRDRIAARRPGRAGHERDRLRAGAGPGERGARPDAGRAAGRARGGQRHVQEPALGARPPERAHRRLQAADQGPGAVPAAVRAPVRDDATDVRGPARPGQPAGAPERLGRPDAEYRRRSSRSRARARRTPSRRSRRGRTRSSSCGPTPPTSRPGSRTSRRSPPTTTRTATTRACCRSSTLSATTKRRTS